MRSLLNTKSILFLIPTILLLSSISLQASSDIPILKLWLKGSFFDNPEHTCDSETPQSILNKLSKTKPFLTETDLIQWNKKPFTATMKSSIASQHKKMEDQCFVMQMGEEIISGVILSVNSSRMFRLPTIMIYDTNQTIKLLNLKTRELP